MRIVFFGTPYYVIPILDSLHKAFRERGVTPIEAVVTSSPKPTGRKQIVEYSPVDEWAHKKNIPIYFDPGRLLKDKIQGDLGILASYGEKIPPEVINYFPKGILVIHPSILPEFRWASPVPAMLVTGTKNVGASILKMDNLWDHGPIITQLRDEILPEDNYQSLRDRLFERSSDVLVQALPSYLNGKINPKKQNDDVASFARMIKKEDAYIDPNAIENAIYGKPDKRTWTIDFIKIDQKPYTTLYSPINIHNFIRAMTPSPGAWTRVKINNQEFRLKLLKSKVNNLNNTLEMEQVQLEGKNPVSWEQLTQGYPSLKF